MSKIITYPAVSLIPHEEMCKTIINLQRFEEFDDIVSEIKQRYSNAILPFIEKLYDPKIEGTKIGNYIYEPSGIVRHYTVKHDSDSYNQVSEVFETIPYEIPNKKVRKSVSEKYTIPINEAKRLGLIPYIQIVNELSKRDVKSKMNMNLFKFDLARFGKDYNNCIDNITTIRKKNKASEISAIYVYAEYLYIAIRNLAVSLSSSPVKIDPNGVVEFDKLYNENAKIFQIDKRKTISKEGLGIIHWLNPKLIPGTIDCADNYGSAPDEGSSYYRNSERARSREKLIKETLYSAIENKCILPAPIKKYDNDYTMQITAPILDIYSPSYPRNFNSGMAMYNSVLSAVKIMSDIPEISSIITELFGDSDSIPNIVNDYMNPEGCDCNGDDLSNSIFEDLVVTETRIGNLSFRSGTISSGYESKSSRYQHILKQKTYGYIGNFYMYL